MTRLMLLMATTYTRTFVVGLYLFVFWGLPPFFQGGSYWHAVLMAHLWGGFGAMLFFVWLLHVLSRSGGCKEGIWWE